METVTPYLNEVFTFVREGFNSVNAVLGLIIALVAAFIMPSWGRLWAVALGATVVNVIADILLPVVSGGAALKLPPVIELSFWRHVLVLFVGYILVVALLYFLRRTLLKGR